MNKNNYPMGNVHLNIHLKMTRRWNCFTSRAVSIFASVNSAVCSCSPTSLDVSLDVWSVLTRWTSSSSEPWASFSSLKKHHNKRLISFLNQLP